MNTGPLRLAALLLLWAGTMNGQDFPMKISLDGDWLFKADSLKTGVDSAWFSENQDRSGWITVQTPRFWEFYPGLANYDGWGWYARTFLVQKISEPLSVHFAGVDDDAVVWLNGVEVGRHTGYSDPFVVDISKAVRTGDNLIVVQVMDYGGGGGIYKPITLIETRYLDDLLKGPYYGKQALKSPDWVRDAVIYEVYLRSFSPEGTFAGLEKGIPALRNLGVTVVWLMPIHPVGVKNRKGTLGSPYAVKDYYAVNPEFGTMQDFKRLLGTVHRNGMKLIIDLVANHTSWDSKLIQEHPEWFRKDRQGNIVSPNSGWADVAGLDYSNAGLRTYMLDMMRWWVKDVGIDGFRCDVAELVPTDFWEEARRRLNRIKPVMMLSEGTIPEHHMKAFDLTYSWNVYDALDPLVKGARPVTLIDELLRSESLQFPVGALRLRFNTNHDKNAWDAPAVTKFGPDGLKLTAVLVNTLPGVPLIYNGEEIANDRKLSLFEKVGIDWSKSSDMRKLYTALFALRREHKALSRGEMIRVGSTDDRDIYAFFRLAGNDRILTVLNFSAEPRTVTLSLPLEKIAPREKGLKFREVFSGATAQVDSVQQDMLLDLEPRGYRIFVAEK